MHPDIFKRLDAGDPIRFAAKAQHVLVTGGTGFIGQQLIHALLADGHRVTVLTRTPERATKLFDEKVGAFQSLDAIPTSDTVDIVVNLAGARSLGLRWTAARKEALLRSRVTLTQNLVRWIGSLQQKPRLLLSASAIGYYGVQPQGDDRLLSETSPPQSVFMSELCQAWEQAAAAAATEHGVPVTCLRFGLVLGHAGALPMMLVPVRMGLGGRLGTGRQWVSWIHIHDLLRTMAHALQDTDPAPFRVYNVTAPEQVRQFDFSKTAARLLNRPCLLPTPAWPLRLTLGEQSDVLLEGQRVEPTRLLAEGFAFTHGTLEGAFKSLGIGTR